ncbi:MAG: sigma-E factor negative regulatory protein [Pseudomonadota bacterium]|nr:sigma-E factor negative regulatory protein [Pseudomonadota bacterium]
MNMQIEAQSDRERISALMDGRLQGADTASALQAAASGEGRECWHLYHLVGDVLRSNDLAGCRHDQTFMQRLSAQLTAEPVRVATPLVTTDAVPALRDVARPAANDGVFRWKVAAGFASFAAVAAIGWGVLGGIGPQQGMGATQLAEGAAASGAGARVVSLAAPVPVTAASGAAPDAVAVMLRDPQLDELLAAHRQAAGVSALGNASGFLRNATFEGSGR